MGGGYGRGKKVELLNCLSIVFGHMILFCCVVHIIISHAQYTPGFIIFIIQATQRALLKSSTNSGFIARQVDAARKRFKELTVPELR